MPDLLATRPAAKGETERLVASVRTLAPLLQAGAETADRQGMLPRASVEALQDHGLWRMRLPEELGGIEASISTQIHVIAELAEIDTASAWCTMVANHSVAVMGTTMPESTLELVFAHGVPACTLVVPPQGTAVPVEGGYLLTGTWRLASSIRHATWIHASTSVEGNRSRRIPLAIPATDVTVSDTWHVTGLRATDSADFSLHGYFIPRELTGPESATSPQLRGRRRYDLSQISALDSYEHLAFALGVGRRALSEGMETICRRSHTKNSADRETVHDQLGRLAVELDAVEALAYAYFARVDEASLEPGHFLDPKDRHKARAIAVQATQVASDCVRMAFLRGGAESLYAPNVLEKLLRDMSVASTHIVVDDAAFAAHGHNILEQHHSMSRKGRPDHVR